MPPHSPGPREAARHPESEAPGPPEPGPPEPGPSAPGAHAGRALEPLDPPMVPIALAGIAAWAIVGLALLVARPVLVEHGNTGWLWICLAGVLWGLLGLAVMRRHDRNRRRRHGDQVDR